MFVESQQQEYSVQLLCQTFHVSRSAYYAWLKGESHQQKASDQQLIVAFYEHRRRYGVRRLVAELRAKGVNIGYHKARRIMKQHGLKAIQPRSFIPRTTDSRHSYAISPNLLIVRSFPVKVNEVWVGDITYIPLYGSNWAYLAVWMDLYSRKIIGWHLADHMREELVVSALKKALQLRSVEKGMIIHSDRGGQYAGNKFRKILQQNHILQSMSRADNPYDNAFMESCFSRFKAELLGDGIFENIEDAQTEIFEYIEMYYNSVRRHSSLGYICPVAFEKQNIKR